MENIKDIKIKIDRNELWWIEKSKEHERTPLGFPLHRWHGPFDSVAEAKADAERVLWGPEQVGKIQWEKDLWETIPLTRKRKRKKREWE